MDSIALELQAACEAAESQLTTDSNDIIFALRNRLTAALPDIMDETYDDLFARASRILNPPAAVKGRPFRKNDRRDSMNEGEHGQYVGFKK